ncbi:Polysacc_synt_C domain-containing protein [Gammaproteobacteria bacterium]
MYLRNIKTWHLGTLAKGTLAMTIGMGLRTVIQTAVFLVIARVLRVSDYGIYSALLALAGTFSNFVGMGMQTVMVREISRDPRIFPMVWGETLFAILLSMPVLWIGYVVIAFAMVPSISIEMVMLIGLAELTFTPIVAAALSAYQGYERIGRASRFFLIPVIPRFAGALLLVALAPITSLENRLVVWGMIYAIASLVGTIYAWKLLKKDLGIAKKPIFSILLKKIPEGLSFSVGNVANRVYVDIDKAILANLSTLEITGIYSAGYRVVDFATVPVLSFLLAALPRFFRESKMGIGHTLRYMWKILPIPFIFTILSSVFLYFFANLLPMLIGVEYAATVSVLQWLAWLPIVSLPRLFLQTLLATTGRQTHVTMILLLGAGSNVFFNLYWIPALGWQGAALATYASEGLMAFLMLLISFRKA